MCVHRCQGSWRPCLQQLKVSLLLVIAMLQHCTSIALIVAEVHSGRPNVPDAWLAVWIVRHTSHTYAFPW